MKPIAICYRLSIVIGGTIFMLLICFCVISIAEISGFTPFVWSGGELSGVFYPKLAMFIPVRIGSHEQTFYLQLDTGTMGSHLYGHIVHALKPDIDSAAVREMEVEWYENHPSIGKNHFPIYWGRTGLADSSFSDFNSRKIGVIGTDMMQGKIILIDYPREEFAVYKDTLEIPVGISREINYIPARFEQGLFYISVILGKDTLSSVFFDTGASLANLLIPFEEWRIATGLEGDEPVILRDTIPAWGKPLPLMRAPAKADMIFGDIHIKSPMLVTAEWADDAKPNFHIMGSAPFYDDYIVIVDFINERMGLMLSANRTK